MNFLLLLAGLAFADTDTFTPTATATATATSTSTATASATETVTATASATSTATATARWRCSSIGTSPVRIFTPDPYCSLIGFSNLGAVSVSLGDHTVSSGTTGPISLLTNDLLLMRREDMARDEWWAVTGVGTTTVCVHCSQR